MQRTDGRRFDQVRKTTISVGYQSFAEGSSLIEMGRTKVLCAASVEERVPTWRRGAGKGWVTAEYAMLPRSTLSRTGRESVGGSVRGRHQEIQRLIGRALRSVTDLSGLGERTVLIDCDVLQADGGTRTAAITGAYVALYQGLHGLVRNGILPRIPLKCAVVGVSVGAVNGEMLLDLSYEEDFRAQVDFNLALTSLGELVEIQATGEDGPFSKGLVHDAVCLAQQGADTLLEIQRQAVETLKLP